MSISATFFGDGGDVIAFSDHTRFFYSFLEILH